MMDSLGISNSVGMKHMTIKPQNINKLLYNKYGETTDELNLMQIEALVYSKNCHLFCVYKEYLVLDYNEEFLKRHYNQDETKERIPKLANYYKNYQRFFCNPFFKSFKLNNVIQEYGDDRAELYYKRTYGDKNKKKGDGLDDQNIQSIGDSGEEYEASNTSNMLFNTTVRRNIDKTIITQTTMRDDSVVEDFHAALALKRQSNRMSKETSLIDILSNLDGLNYHFESKMNKNSKTPINFSTTDKTKGEEGSHKIEENHKEESKFKRSSKLPMKAVGANTNRLLFQKSPLRLQGESYGGLSGQNFFTNKVDPSQQNKETNRRSQKSLEDNVEHNSLKFKASLCNIYTILPSDDKTKGNKKVYTKINEFRKYKVNKDSTINSETGRYNSTRKNHADSVISNKTNNNNQAEKRVMLKSSLSIVQIENSQKVISKLTTNICRSPQAFKSKNNPATVKDETIRPSQSNVSITNRPFSSITSRNSQLTTSNTINHKNIDQKDKQSHLNLYVDNSNKLFFSSQHNVNDVYSPNTYKMNHSQEKTIHFNMANANSRNKNVSLFRVSSNPTVIGKQNSYTSNLTKKRNDSLITKDKPMSRNVVKDLKQMNTGHYTKSNIQDFLCLQSPHTKIKLGTSDIRDLSSSKYKTNMVKASSNTEALFKTTDLRKIKSTPRGNEMYIKNPSKILSKLLKK